MNSKVKRMKRNVALSHLKRDPVMADIIDKYSLSALGRPGDLFQDIIENIFGQQLSSGPANIITQRFKNLFQTKPFPKPAEILAMPDEKIRSCGTSWAKVSYIKNFCQAIVDGELDLESVRKLPDEEVIVELTKIKGIGRWTAEMILIFYLQRPDVFSLIDLGLCTAVARHYKVDRKNVKKIAKISQVWSPYRSLASRYLWESIDKK